MDNNIYTYDAKLNEIVTPKKDLVFKRIFGKKGNEAILKDFLEAILEIKIKSLTLDLNKELVPEFYGKKASEVDVRARLQDGTEVNVEIQVNKNEYSEKRCLYYWSKLYSDKLDEGNEYGKLNKVICIWIIDGEIYKEFPDFMSKWEVTNEKYGVKGHFREMEIHIIELQKFRKSATIKGNVRDFWLAFIDYQSRELIQMGCITNEQIKKAKKELDKIRANKDIMDAIFALEIAEFDYNTAMGNAKREGLRKGKREGRAIGIEQGRKEGRKEGQAEGRAEGRAEGIQEIIMSMLKANMSIEQIASIAGLPKEKIQEIAKSEELK